jgi:hypothetical protein
MVCTVCFSVCIYFEVYLKNVEWFNRYVQSERWPCPFKVFSLINVTALNADLWLSPAFRGLCLIKVLKLFLIEIPFVFFPDIWVDSYNNEPGKREKVYQCAYCHRILQSAAHLVRHTRTHTGEKPFACRFCEFRTSRKDQLRLHERRKHSDLVQAQGYTM